MIQCFAQAKFVQTKGAVRAEVGCCQLRRPRILLYLVFYSLDLVSLREILFCVLSRFVST
jgi:hypothetical protein